MKTIGMLGGMSPESTRVYYDRINRKIRQELGADHSAKILLYSLDFAPIKRLAHQGEWETIAAELIKAAQKVERGGADFLLLCTNTVHKVAEEVRRELRVPLLHIVDLTAEAAKHHGSRRVGVLGTRFTMEDGFYTDRLRSHHGMEAMVPGATQRERLHRLIYDELCHGKISPESGKQCTGMIDELKRRGADAVVLACTELSLMRNVIEASLPILDGTEIHADAAADLALQGEE